MSIKITRLRGSNKSTGKCKLGISGEMNIYTANEQKDALLAPLPDYREFHLQLDKVEEFDSCGVQNLVLMRREAEAMNKSVVIDSCSPVVQDVLTMFSLNEYFGLHTAIDGAAS